MLIEIRNLCDYKNIEGGYLAMELTQMKNLKMDKFRKKKGRIPLAEEFSVS